MLRAVLDSSVLISIFLTPRGATAEMLGAARRGAFVLCLSEAILEETTRKLRMKRASLQRRYGYSEEEIETYEALLRETAEITTNLPLLDAVPNDPKDNPIVATAVAATADYLVTGDRAHLLRLGSYQNIPIVSVRRFLDLLAA